MKGIFACCKGKVFSGMEDWDVSNVESVSWMFISCYAFNSDLSKWDVSAETDTTDMFIGCSIKNEYKTKGLQK